MSSFIRQNLVNMANEPLNDQPPLLKSLISETDELRSITNSAFFPITKITAMGTNFPSQNFE